MKNKMFSKLLYVSFSLTFLGIHVFPLPSSVAEDYPTRPVSIINTAAPGGSLDLGCRIFASTAEKYLGQPVVVMNKTGAGGMDGAMHVVSATPDGYTLGWFIDVFQTPEMYTYFRGKPSYTSNDLKPISSLFSSLQSLAVKADAPWKNFAELIAYSRNNRGLKFGSNPEGSGPNLMMRIVSKKEDLDWKAVPLNDDPVILTNLLGGNVPMGTVGYSTVKPQLNAGKVRILVVFSDKRLTGAPEFPTIGECGYPLAYTPSTGVFAPKGVPDSVVRKLETTVKKVIEDASFREKIREIGFPISYRDSNELTELTARNKISLEKVFREFGYWK